MLVLTEKILAFVVQNMDGYTIINIEKLQILTGSATERKCM